MKTKSLSIAILGTRGIPNQYGGYEACAQELGVRLAERGHEVFVYTVNHHPMKETEWMGMKRVLIRDPLKLGTFGQFVYDMRSNLHSRKHKIDIVLHLGYTSDSVWLWLWPKKSIHITNMDGQEWKRAKFSPGVRNFLKYAEKLAAKGSNWLVADSRPIESYLLEKYRKPVRYIAYGAEIPSAFETEIPQHFGLEIGSYDLAIARMEPENNIELMIQAKLISEDTTPLAIVGNINNYKQMLIKKYKTTEQILFMDAIYEKERINSLRHFCRLYLHGHSVGGTNPSLLEAMACSCSIVAHKNPFNEAVLGSDADYFSNKNELASFFFDFDFSKKNNRIINNLNKIEAEYNWEFITDAYELLFNDAINSK
jgi:glycosyltransferase involved in cell wall biosynthesis